MAYVAESYYGDKLSFYVEQLSEEDFLVRVTRHRDGETGETEACRCGIKFVKDCK